MPGDRVPSVATRRADWADTTGWALRRSADGLELHDDDVARIEERYEGHRDVRHSGRGRGHAWRGQLVMAAVVLLSLGLSATALASARDAERRADRAAAAVASLAATAAGPVAPGGVALAGPTDIGGLDRLEGLWRLEADEAWPPLWVIRADGTFEVLRPRDLLHDALGAGSVRLQAPDRLRLSDASGCVAWFRAESLSRDRLRLHRLTPDGACRGDLGTGGAWSVSDVVRVAPGSVPVRSRYAGGSAQPLRWASGLDGVWLLQGSGRLLAVDGRRYAVLDDVTARSASGGRRIVERGIVRTGPGGRVELRPTGASCPRAYRVWTDYATLDARLQDTSCGRVGEAADTWVRLM
jgi:hypothetical protein